MIDSRQALPPLGMTRPPLFTLGVRDSRYLSPARPLLCVTTQAQQQQEQQQSQEELVPGQRSYEKEEEQQQEGWI